MRVITLLFNIKIVEHLCGKFKRDRRVKNIEI